MHELSHYGCDSFNTRAGTSFHSILCCFSGDRIQRMGQYRPDDVMAGHSSLLVSSCCNRASTGSSPQINVSYDSPLSLPNICLHFHLLPCRASTSCNAAVSSMVVSAMSLTTLH